MLLEQAVIVGLAAWRVAHLLGKEEGPFDLFARLRQVMGVPGSGEIKGFLPTLLTCPWCLTVWLVPVFWALWYVHWAIPALVAATTVAVGAERLIETDG